ncbi:MAG: hypothetical protein QOH25_1555, partial [Acidobacteriota bacterium]|nr:hypothetical protein [Acidobacteriota bacterium]
LYYLERHPAALFILNFQKPASGQVKLRLPLCARAEHHVIAV